LNAKIGWVELFPCGRSRTKVEINMPVIRALFDGNEIKPVEPIKTTKKTEVLVIFPDEGGRFAPEEARSLLKGSARGEGLIQELLKSRAEDIGLEPG